MPMRRIAIRTGVDVESTPLLNEAGISDCNCIRHFKGKQDQAPLLQKLGGWARLTSDPVTGSCRGIHPWADLAGNGYYGFGSEYQLAVYPLVLGHLADITPSSATNNLTNAFTTTANSATVTILDATTSPTPGTWILIGNAVYIDGLVLQGFYQVQTANPGAHTYTITAAAKALAGVAAGGTLITFTTANGQQNVGIAQGARVFQAGQTVSVYTSTAVGGLTLLGTYPVQMQLGNPVIDAGAFATGNANATENGGAAAVRYLSLGALPDGTLTGYGEGPFGGGPMGIGIQSIQQPRQWAIDNFGANMVAAPINGPLFQWVPPYAPANYATAVAGAPQFSAAMFVAMPQEQVISLGSDAGGSQDPLLVRFSDVGNYVGSGAWTASATNQAGSFRLTSGTKIVGGLQGPQQGFIWTDLSLWTMNYLGFPLVYSFIKVADGCGLAAPRGAAYIANMLIWIGRRGFWQYTGGEVVPLACPVWDFFFNNLDQSFAGNIFCAPNAGFTEIAWYFPPLGVGGLPKNYVKVNLLTGDWDKGVLTRTAWADASAISFPLATDGTNGLIQQHEIATDADGATMPSFLLTGYFVLNDGDDFYSIGRLIPDFVLNQGGAVGVSVVVSRYPNDPVPRTFGPFTAKAATQFIISRCRGRYFQLKFDFSAFGTFARIGKISAVGGLSGKRP